MVWGVSAASLALVALLLPGIWIDTGVRWWWLTAALLPVEFGLLLLLLRPLLVLATLPLNAVTLGLPTLLFNGLILYLTAATSRVVNIDNLGYAFLGLVVMTVVNGAVTGWLGIDDVYPFFQTILRRIGLRFGPRARPGQVRGLLILQVDGLSWRSCERALRRGRMPTVAGLRALGTHRLHRWHCGVPSNTPAVQSGLFYGARTRLPGYRWYDRRCRRVLVASRAEDLRDAEAEIVGGPGLLAGGSCINSLLSGGAAKRLLTLSALREPDDHRRPGERADFSLFWLSPFAYTSAVTAALWDFLTAVSWNAQARFHPRKRVVRRSLRQAAMRAVGNAFLRETSFFWLAQDVVRGVPVIYSNFVGYDEVAHHAGPDDGEALATLTGFDRKLQKLRRLVRDGAPIGYDVVVLADHGQSASLPLRALGGETLEELVARLAGRVRPVPPPRDNEAVYVGALLAELRDEGPDRRSWLAYQSRLTLERLRDVGPDLDHGAGEGTSLLVCVSGGLAHIYREGAPRPLRLAEMTSLYPGLVEGLASHAGIGFVLARDDDGTALMIGRDGVRNLDTGELRGDADPLAPYWDRDLWTGELSALLSHPHAGDLIVNGALLPDRRVVVFEEQLGSHGGLGGPQTEPFILLPAAWGTTRGDLRSPEALYAHLKARLEGSGDAPAS
ncbi:MAG: phage holin family protein [bacterium]|nr:phage holin family protein [bacterium]